MHYRTDTRRKKNRHEASLPKTNGLKTNGTPPHVTRMAHTISASRCYNYLIGFTIVIIATLSLLWTPPRIFVGTALGAKTYSYRCTTDLSTFSSWSQAVSLCSSASAVMATPMSASENAAAFATVGSNGRAALGGVQVYDWGLNLLVWAYESTGTNKGEIFWVQPNKAQQTSGYAPNGMYTAWWPGQSPTDIIVNTLTMHSSAGVWYNDYVTNAKCTICQQEACSSACSPAGTASYSGTWWPSCLCICKAGYVGVACTRQIEVYAVASISSAADVLAFCASKGGFVAQPANRAEEDAILKYVPAAVAGGTDISKAVVIGAYASSSARTYCYGDGQRKGACVAVGGAVVAGQYSDFGSGVPTTPLTTPLTVLRSLSQPTLPPGRSGVQSAPPDEGAGVPLSTYVP